MRACIVVDHVLTNGKFGFTHTTPYGLGIKFISCPYLGRMIYILFMALIARIVLLATFELNGNNIKWRVIMSTSGLLVNYFASDFHVLHIINKQENSTINKQN